MTDPAQVRMEDAFLRLRTHEFEVFEGASGRVCTAMVIRDGYGDQCGLPADDPVHAVA